MPAFLQIKSQLNPEDILQPQAKRTSAVVSPAFSNCVVGHLPKSTVLSISAVFTVQEKSTTLPCKLILIVPKGSAAHPLEIHSNPQKQLKSALLILRTSLIIDA